MVLCLLLSSKQKVLCSGTRLNSGIEFATFSFKEFKWGFYFSCNLVLIWFMFLMMSFSCLFISELQQRRSLDLFRLWIGRKL